MPLTKKLRRYDKAKVRNYMSQPEGLK